MGILNNPKINEISDDDLIQDLDNYRLTIELKTAVILELSRRQLIKLDKSSKKLNILTRILIFLTAVLAIFTAILIFR